jgi:hypothetical protein
MVSNALAIGAEREVRARRTDHQRRKVALRDEQRALHRVEHIGGDRRSRFLERQKRRPAG